MHASDLHTVFSEVHVGSLTLVGVALVLLVLHHAHMRLLRGRWKRLDRLSLAIPRMADPVAYLGAMFGLFGFVGSVVSGTFTWRPEALWSTPEVLNKVMLSVLALELWIVFIAVRFRYGIEVLRTRRLLALYLAVGFVAFGLTTVSASLGGHLAGKESLLDPVYRALLIDTTAPWTLAPFVWLVNLAYGAPPFFGMPVRGFYVLLLLLDLGVVAAVVALLLRHYVRRATRGPGEDSQLCHPDDETPPTGQETHPPARKET
ncbi:MAG: hypothetical protein ACE5LS_00780 [Thermoplasmata archaeon]